MPYAEGMPRWLAAVALLAVGALYATISTDLTLGPRLLLPGLDILLVVALISAHAGGGARGWSPGFVDYLFLAFNTSTAFSPTDTAILSRRAKVLTMAQSLISLAVVAVLIGRAVNTRASAGGVGG